MVKRRRSVSTPCLSANVHHKKGGKEKNFGSPEVQPKKVQPKEVQKRSKQDLFGADFHQAAFTELIFAGLGDLTKRTKLVERED